MIIKTAKATWRLIATVLTPVIVRWWYLYYGKDIVPFVARCLMVLNIRARALVRWSEKKEIYRIKSWVIVWLALNGYLVDISHQKQATKCRKCGGTGTVLGAWYGEHIKCWKCTDGVYRVHHLTLFVFNINDKPYLWHQPSNLLPYYIVPQRDTWDSLPQYTVDQERNPGKIIETYWSLVLIAFLSYWLKKEVGFIPSTHIHDSSIKNAVANWWLSLRYPFYNTRIGRMVWRWKDQDFTLREIIFGKVYTEEDDIPF